MTQKRYDLIRYFAYTLELLLLFMLQQTPSLLPEILGGRPVLLIPAAILIAMYETNVISMAFGIAAGLLLDFASGHGLGFHAIVLAVLCFLFSSLCMELIQTNFLTALAAGAVLTGIVILLQWLALYVGPGYSQPFYAFIHHYLARFVYTYLFILPLYFLNRLLAVNINPTH